MKQGVKINCAGGNYLSKNTYIFIGSLLKEEKNIIQHSNHQYFNLRRKNIPLHYRVKFYEFMIYTTLTIKYVIKCTQKFLFDLNAIHTNSRHILWHCHLSVHKLYRVALLSSF